MTKLLSLEGYLDEMELKKQFVDKIDEDLKELKSKGKSKTLDQYLHYLTFGAYFDKTKDEITKKKTVSDFIF